MKPRNLHPLWFIGGGVGLFMLLVFLAIQFPKLQAVTGTGSIVALIIGILAVYFLPSIIAFGSKKRNAGAIFALNLLLGWSFLGWVLALVWALTKD